jgi:hypothetical protein
VTLLAVPPPRTHTHTHTHTHTPARSFVYGEHMYLKPAQSLTRHHHAYFSLLLSRLYNLCGVRALTLFVLCCNLSLTLFLFDTRYTILALLLLFIYLVYYLRPRVRTFRHTFQHLLLCASTGHVLLYFLRLSFIYFFYLSIYLSTRLPIYHLR